MEPAKKLRAAVAEFTPTGALPALDEGFAKLVLGAGAWMASPRNVSFEESPDTIAADATSTAAAGVRWLTRLDAANRQRLYALPRRLSPFTLSYLALRREFLVLREGMCNGRRPRDDRFIRAGAGTVAHELQLRFVETEAFAHCLHNGVAAKGVAEVALVEAELFALGEQSAARARRLAGRAARWHRAAREACAFLLPGNLLDAGQQHPPVNLAAAERMFFQFDPAQRGLLEESWTYLESLREARCDLRDSLLAAFHQMQSEPSACLSELFAVASTYSVLEARTALVEAKTYMRIAITLRLDQRRAIGELLA